MLPSARASRREQRHEEHQDARHKHGGQRVVIAALRVGYHVRIDGDRLQCSLDLCGRRSLGRERGLTHCRRSERADGLHVLHRHRAGRHTRHRVVVRNLRLAPSQKLRRRALGNVEVGIHLTLLHSVARLGDVGKSIHHARALHSVEVADQSARRGAIVLIHHTYGQV